MPLLRTSKTPYFGPFWTPFWYPIPVGSNQVGPDHGNDIRDTIPSCHGHPVGDPLVPYLGVHFHAYEIGVF